MPVDDARQTAHQTPDSDAEASRFFAVPQVAINGFAEVTALARQLATLPTRLDLDHYARAEEDSAIGIGRRQVLRPPDVDFFSARERRVHAQTTLGAMVRAVKAARGGGGVGRERPQWQLGPTNCYLDLPSPRTAPLRLALEAFFETECICIGDQFYPPGAFRAWHTDRYAYTGSGWTVFLVQVAQPFMSSFRYVDPQSGELVVVPDRDDMAYFFRAAEAPLFWHSVLCEGTYRWSQGFTLPADWHSRVFQR